MALVCLDIVGQHDRSWISESVKTRCRQEEISNFRISRLKTRLVSVFEGALIQVTRRVGGGVPETRESADS